MGRSRLDGSGGLRAEPVRVRVRARARVRVRVRVGVRVRVSVRVRLGVRSVQAAATPCVAGCNPA